MQGIIFTELKRFVTVTCGEQAWTAVLAEARLTSTPFSDDKTFPHVRADEIIGALARMTGIRREKAYEAFGEFVMPKLMPQFQTALERGMSAEDFVVRLDKLLAKTVFAGESVPPMLAVEQVRPGEFRLTHEADEGFANLFVGVLRAIGTHFGRQILVSPNAANEYSVHLLSEASLLAT